MQLPLERVVTQQIAGSLSVQCGQTRSGLARGMLSTDVKYDVSARVPLQEDQDRVAIGPWKHGDGGLAAVGIDPSLGRYLTLSSILVYVCVPATPTTRNH